MFARAGPGASVGPRIHVRMSQASVIKVFFFSALSVRARIIAIAVVPVVGFLANGIAFPSGEAEVDAAFTSVKRAAVLSDTANDFKAALATMRLTVRDFASKPETTLVSAFDESRQLATDSLDAIEGSLTDKERKDIPGLRDRLASGFKSFGELVKEHEALGFTDDQGIRRLLRDGAQNVERIVHVDLAKEEGARPPGGAG